MLRVTPRLICAVAALTLAAFAPAATAATNNEYIKERPYGNPKDTQVRTPPSGYHVFFLESVARHGARSQVNDHAEEDALELWEQAEKKYALTEIGKNLSRDIQRFQAAERKVGYGRLSELGRIEMAGIGRRTADNYAPFFAFIKRNSKTISTVTSDITRTKQSATSLVKGLKAGFGSSLDTVLAEPVESQELLRFSGATSEAGRKIVNTVRNRNYVKVHAEHVLATSYKRSFVDSIDNPVEAALDLYSLFKAAPSMQRETGVTFTRYVPKEDRETLSYISDVEIFYRHGPGVKGETNSFRNARPLLADFFEHLDRRIAGGSKAAIFHVGHGETTMPFMALIKAPGSQKQTAKGEIFSRSSNPWRSADAGRLSGSVEWTALRNKKNQYLVTMRVNEVPVPFHSGCTPYKKNSYFYRVSELKDCLG